MHRHYGVKQMTHKPAPRTLRRLGLGLAAGLVLATLSACTEGLDTSVTRFAVALPAPAGQSFFILPEDPANAGGIEFGQYASDVAAHLTRLGYVPAASADSAALTVHLGYGVDKGHQEIDTSPAYDPFFYGGWGGGWGRGWGRGRWGGGWGFGYGPGWGACSPYGAWGYGYCSPWFVDASTVYTSGITLKIDARNGGQRLFEGRAEAASTSNHLTSLVPNLIEAMFTNFPGNSGKTVRITVAPEKK